MQRGFRQLPRIVQCINKNWRFATNKNLAIKFSPINRFKSTMAYNTIERGAPNTVDYRVYFCKFL